MFGFVDHAVVSDRALIPKVAGLLPGYGRGAAGWYEGVSDWMPDARRRLEEPGDLGEPDVPDSDDGDAGARITADLKTALANFAAMTGADLVEDDLGARRLLAMAALGRVWPSVDQAHQPLARRLVAADLGTVDLVRALVPFTIDGDEGTAGSLLALFGRQVPGESWPDTLARAVDDGLVAPATADQHVTADVWVVRPAAVGSSIAFHTRQRIVGMALGDFGPLFDPAKWTNYEPPWCAMTKGTPVDGHDLYLESISVSCPPVGPFRLITPLLFRVDALPDGTGTALQYRLAPDARKLGGDGMVSVDEGSIVVRQWQSAIHLITTKRIQFRAFDDLPPLVDAWIAQFVWTLGYSALAEQFLNRVTQRSRIQVTDESGSGAGPSRLRPGPSGSEQFVGVWKREVTECADGIESVVGKVRTGSYGAADYVDDLGKFVQHVARYSGDLLDVTARWLSGGGVAGQKTYASGSGRCVSEPLALPPGPTATTGPGSGTVVLECSDLAPGLQRTGAAGARESIAASHRGVRGGPERLPSRVPARRRRAPARQPTRGDVHRERHGAYGLRRRRLRVRRLDRRPLIGGHAMEDGGQIETASLRSGRSQPRAMVLFCDLVGSTELSGRHDPERYGLIVGQYVRDRPVDAGAALRRSGRGRTGGRTPGPLRGARRPRRRRRAGRPGRAGGRRGRPRALRRRPGASGGRRWPCGSPSIEVRSTGTSTPSTA